MSDATLPTDPALSPRVAVTAAAIVGLALVGPTPALATVAAAALLAVGFVAVSYSLSKASSIKAFARQQVRFVHAAIWCGGLVAGCVLGAAMS